MPSVGRRGNCADASSGACPVEERALALVIDKVCHSAAALALLLGLQGAQISFLECFLFLIERAARLGGRQGRSAGLSSRAKLPGACRG